MKLNQEDKQFIAAEMRLIKASKLLDSWFKSCLKSKHFTLDDMSDVEINFMDSVKEFKRAEKLVKGK
jgi:hypothetical protein